jgi:hypothetical protein
VFGKGFPVGTPTGFKSINFNTLTCKHLEKWGSLSKDDFGIMSPSRGTWIFLNWVFLGAKLDTLDNITKNGEMEALVWSGLALLVRILQSGPSRRTGRVYKSSDELHVIPRQWEVLIPPLPAACWVTFSKTE